MPKEEDRRPEKAAPKEPSSTLSRRGFLRDAGLIAGGSIVGPIADIPSFAASAPEVTGSVTASGVSAVDATASQKIKLNVNGEDYEVQVDPEESLRDCLREKLGYLSIKDMCLGHGACGSCTVIMDGRLVR